MAEMTDAELLAHLKKLLWEHLAKEPEHTGVKFILELLEYSKDKPSETIQ